MAVQRLVEKKENKKDLNPEDFIYAKEKKLKKKIEEVQITLRIPKELLEKIDELRLNPPYLSRNKVLIKMLNEQVKKKQRRN